MVDPRRWAALLLLLGLCPAALAVPAPRPGGHPVRPADAMGVVARRFPLPRDIPVTRRPVLRTAPLAADRGSRPRPSHRPTGPTPAPATGPLGLGVLLLSLALSSLAAVWLRGARCPRPTGPPAAVALATTTGQRTEGTDAGVGIKKKEKGMETEDRQWRALGEWLVRDCGARPTEGPPLRIACGADGVRGLVTTRAVLPNELLISLPLALLTEASPAAAPVAAAAAADNDADDAPEALAWGARMAADLLQDIAKQRRGEPSRWGPWYPLLPAECPTPPLQFTDAELRACEDTHTIREAEAIAGMAEDSWDLLRPDLEGFDREDFYWALSILHSRCFFQGSSMLHTVAPGIDMANHALPSSCYIAYSFPSSQGRLAEEDVTDTPTPPAPPSLEVRAEEGGLEKGQEVTISYGRWPNDVFFLFFGFIPDGHNPNDDVVLFADAPDLAAAVVDDALSLSGAAREERVESIARDIEERCKGDARRLVARADGVDARLLASQPALGLTDPQLGALLRRRAQKLLAGYSTTAAEDEGLLGTADLSPNMALSIRYRLNKKRILQVHAGATGPATPSAP